MINATSSLKLGAWFDYLIKYVMPLILISILGFGVLSELRENIFKGGLYGFKLVSEQWSFLPLLCLIVWLTISTGAALTLCRMPGKGHSGGIKLSAER
ncbi:MAG: hypothetical protein P9M14_12400 [Candidatus Alcyoniella australis]|nr:hypothetical protein [Candidatus Alcyoniella australis]